MYVVYRFNTRINKGSLGKKFTTYEAARSAVRKVMRKALSIARGWYAYSNPSITNGGYSIKKVSG